MPGIQDILMALGTGGAPQGNIPSPALMGGLGNMMQDMQGLSPALQGLLGPMGPLAAGMGPGMSGMRAGQAAARGINPLSAQLRQRLMR